MATTTIDRTNINLTDDSGSGTDGTVINAAWATEFMDKINLLLSADLELGGDLTVVDNKALTLGTGGDATMQFNGTNLLINPQAVGSGNTVLSAGDFYTTAWTDYFASSTIVGWSSLTAGRRAIMYKRIGDTVFISAHLEGTSDATTVSFTLPFTSIEVGASFSSSGALGFTFNNGSAITPAGRFSLPDSSATVTADLSPDTGGGWTASGTKIVELQFWYQAA